jgi:hypothetical protein
MPPSTPGRTSVDYGASTWRTGDRQSTEYVKSCKWYLQVRYAPYKGARGQTLKTASSADKYERTWATRAAAIAAKTTFKEWVNGGRSSQQRAAAAASATSRAETVQAARLRPLTPVHFCGSTRLEAAQVTVGLRIGAADAVSVVLNCLAHSSEELLGIWRHRSAQVINRGERRRDAAEVAADFDPTSGIWELFFARCKAAKLDAGELLSSSKPIPRGIARAVRIGQHRHHHTTTARKEQRWAAQKQAVAAAHLVRVDRIRVAAEGAAQRQRRGIAARGQ